MAAADVCAQALVDFQTYIDDFNKGDLEAVLAHLDDGVEMYHVMATDENPDANVSEYLKLVAEARESDGGAALEAASKLRGAPISKGKEAMRPFYDKDMKAGKQVKIRDEMKAVAKPNDAAGEVSVFVGLLTTGTALDVEYVYRTADMKHVRHITSNVKQVAE